MKKILSILTLMMPLLASAQINIGREKLTVEVDITEPYDSVGRDHAIEVTPLLTSAAGDTLRLEPVVFRGKGNLRYIKRLRSFGDEPEAAYPEIVAGTTYHYTSHIACDQASWAWQQPVTLTLDRKRSGCCDTEQLPRIVLNTAEYVVPFAPVVLPVPDFTGKAGELQTSNQVLQHISAYRPYDKTRILRKEEGALYVHFPLDKWELNGNFRNNGAILDKIVDITRQIMADTTSSVKIIQIIGLASVEGSAKRNANLAGNRAEALKAYIQKRVATPDSLYEVVNGGEAWTELRDQINDMGFEYREQLLNIIDNQPNADQREQQIKKLAQGKAFAYLRENVLSDQRNSGYLRIYYDYVPDKAAAEINKASEMLNEEKYAEALALLTAQKDDPRSWNALGVALYMTGDKAAGIEYIRKAADTGNADAIENIRQLTR